jgi:hypothetical protein
MKHISSLASNILAGLVLEHEQGHQIAFSTVMRKIESSVNGLPRFEHEIDWMRI